MAQKKNMNQETIELIQAKKNNQIIFLNDIYIIISSGYFEIVTKDK